MKFEVRTHVEIEGGAGDEYVVETTRTDRKAADVDVDLLKMLGRAAWIVEIE